VTEETTETIEDATVEISTPAVETPASEPSLTGDKELPEPVLSNDLTHDKPSGDEHDFDKRLFSEDGKFNADGAKEVFAEFKTDKEKGEDRILKMRQMVSTKDDFVKDKEEFFQDFAPPEKFMKYFNEETPEETKTVLHGITGKLAEKFHDVALNRKQALEVSHSILEVLEDVGVLDTRSKTEVYADKQQWIDDQKAKLGSNADNIIRESKEFIYNSPAFTPSIKNSIIDMMDTLGADFVAVVDSLKDSFGSNTGGVPSGIASLGGLGTDSELWQEYLKADTTDLRRNEIINLRAKAGRTGRLADAGNI